jgi:outer membrane usher protein
LSVKQTASDDFTDFNTNASLSTNLYYAGGLFGISASSSSNFLLLKTTGKLSGSPISVSKTNDSSPKQLNSLFGTSVYTDLTANSKNNLIIYSESDSVYSSGGTFSYELNTSSRTGFTKVLSIPTSYTVSGVLYNTDGLPYAQYSSPVYTREIDENGNYYLQISESQYLFTDANGRWILNDVSPGIYVFDLQVGNDWFALSFDIPDDEENDGKVIEIEDYQAEEKQPELISWDVDLETEQASTEEDDISVDTFGNEIVAEYAKVVLLNIARVTDEQTFAQTSSQEFAPTGFEQTIGTDDDSTEVEFDPFADTASSWDDSEYDDWTF